MKAISSRALTTLTVSAGLLGALTLSSASVAAAVAYQGTTDLHQHAPLRVTSVLAGSSLRHSFIPPGSTAPRSEVLSDPDDISQLGRDIFVGFQNGVGPQGQPSSDGNQDSTVVEMSLTGRALSQWDVVGKTDGVTADPALGGVIATVNEDANSALYVIRPSAGPAAVTRFAYNEVLPHGGGTDAISIYAGQIFISASAPGTSGAPAPQPTYPALYSVTLDWNSQMAKVRPLFFDEDSAAIANANSPQLGKSTQLALTDPDSNEVVPSSALRFAGDFVLTSQGDQEQIYVSAAGSPRQRLHVLALSQSVDDTAWPAGVSGRLYTTDSTHDSVDVVTGQFRADQPLVVATPCGANSAPATCPAPPSYPSNYLGTLNPWTGLVTPVVIEGTPYVPEGGLAFVPGPSW